jgi:hypothetical protein
MGVKISYRKLSSKRFGIAIPDPDPYPERMLVCVRYLTHDTCILSLYYDYVFRYDRHKMASSGSSSRKFPIGGIDEHGQASPGFEALRGIFGRVAGSLSSGAKTTNVTPTRADIPLTSAEKVHSQTESVFLRSRSPVNSVPNFRMVTQGDTNPSPVTFGVDQEDGWRGVRRTQWADLERKDRQAKNLPDPAFDDLLTQPHAKCPFWEGRV